MKIWSGLKNKNWQNIFFQIWQLCTVKNEVWYSFKKWYVLGVTLSIPIFGMPIILLVCTTYHYVLWITYYAYGMYYIHATQYAIHSKSTHMIFWSYDKQIITKSIHVLYMQEQYYLHTTYICSLLLLQVHIHNYMQVYTLFVVLSVSIRFAAYDMSIRPSTHHGICSSIKWMHVFIQLLIPL